MPEIYMALLLSGNKFAIIQVRDAIALHYQSTQTRFKRDLSHIDSVLGLCKGVNNFCSALFKDSGWNPEASKMDRKILFLSGN